jgi:hypothetical protein
MDERKASTLDGSPVPGAESAAVEPPGGASRGES